MTLYNIAYEIMKTCSDEEWSRIRESADYNYINGTFTSGELAVLVIKLLEDKFQTKAMKFGEEND